MLTEQGMQIFSAFRSQVPRLGCAATKSLGGHNGQFQNLKTKSLFTDEELGLIISIWDQHYWRRLFGCASVTVEEVSSLSLEVCV